MGIISMGIISYAVARLKEPSSWASLMGLIGGVGIVMPAGVAQNIAVAGAALAGIVAYFLPENK